MVAHELFLRYKGAERDVSRARRTLARRLRW